MWMHASGRWGERDTFIRVQEPVRIQPLSVPPLCISCPYPKARERHSGGVAGLRVSWLVRRGGNVIYSPLRRRGRNKAQSPATATAMMVLLYSASIALLRCYRGRIDGALRPRCSPLPTEMRICLCLEGLACAL